MKKQDNSPGQLMGGVASVATPAEVRRMKRRCSGFEYASKEDRLATPFKGKSCQKKAWLVDWAGWRWCFRHWYNSWRWGGSEHKWFELKKLKIF